MKNWRNKVDELRIKLTSNSPQSNLNEMEKQWQKISADNLDDRFQYFDCDNLLDAISLYVQFDRYPPPELLHALANQYLEYLESKGQKSLEETFFGPVKKGVGNYASRLERNNINFFLKFALNQGRKNNLSKIKIAEKFIAQHNLPIDPESLLRNYRRKKSI